MAELLQVVEPTEKSYDIRLTESEMSALLFLMDFADQNARVTYQSHKGGRNFTVFKPSFKKVIQEIENGAFLSSRGYTHAQDYME